MSAENHNHQPSLDQSVLGSSSKRKRLILYDKTFVTKIAEKKVSSKIEKLICLHGGKIMQSLEKHTDYLISDILINERVKHKSGSELSNCRRDIEVQNAQSSKSINSTDLINKAHIFNTKILSVKQFHHWLKSSLKKRRLNKKPTDKVANVLRGKVSLKIESMDQGQCPVFEFIPKWPDLGVTLSKKKPIIRAQNNFNGNVSGDEYSSDQYSTSEIGGMCEICDMPFMNYKEHINTKKHMRESQDENRFHELDELINERPLNVLFNHFEPDKKISDDENVTMEQSNVKNCIEDTVVTIVDSDSDDNNEQKNMNSSFGVENPNILKETSLKRKLNSTTIRFIPQKRPCKLRKSSHKKNKRKQKTHQKTSSKDIYKVEVVNNQPSISKNDSNYDINMSNNKPPVIIRLKRVKHSKRKKTSSDDDSHISISSDDIDDSHISISSDDIDDYQDIPEDPIPIQRCIRVVRKPSFSNETESKRLTQNHIFTFEHPEFRQKFSNEISYYPTHKFISNTRPSIDQIQEKIAILNNPRFECKLSINESLKIISKMNHQKIGEWFYNIPKKIEDNSLLNSAILMPSIN